MSNCRECGNPIIFRYVNGRNIPIHTSGGCNGEPGRYFINTGETVKQGFLGENSGIFTYLSTFILGSFLGAFLIYPLSFAFIFILFDLATAKSYSYETSFMICYFSIFHGLLEDENNNIEIFHKSVFITALIITIYLIYKNFNS